MSRNIYEIGLRPIVSAEQFFNDTSFNDYDDNCPKRLLLDIKEELLDVYGDFAFLRLTTQTLIECADEMRKRLKLRRESGELINFKVEESDTPDPETKVIDIYLQPSCTIETVCFTATLT